MIVYEYMQVSKVNSVLCSCVLFCQCFFFFFYLGIGSKEFIKVFIVF